MFEERHDGRGRGEVPDSNKELRRQIEKTTAKTVNVSTPDGVDRFVRASMIIHGKDELGNDHVAVVTPQVSASGLEDYHKAKNRIVSRAIVAIHTLEARGEMSPQDATRARMELSIGGVGLQMKVQDMDRLTKAAIPNSDKFNNYSGKRSSATYSTGNYRNYDTGISKKQLIKKGLVTIAGLTFLLSSCRPVEATPTVTPTRVPSATPEQTKIPNLPIGEVGNTTDIQKALDECKNCEGATMENSVLLNFDGQKFLFFSNSDSKYSGRMFDNNEWKSIFGFLNPDGSVVWMLPSGEGVNIGEDLAVDPNAKIVLTYQKPVEGSPFTMTVTTPDGKQIFFTLPEDSPATKKIRARMAVGTEYEEVQTTKFEKVTSLAEKDKMSTITLEDLKPGSALSKWEQAQLDKMGPIASDPSLIDYVNWHIKSADINTLTILKEGSTNFKGVKATELFSLFKIDLDPWGFPGKSGLVVAYAYEDKVGNKAMVKFFFPISATKLPEHENLFKDPRGRRLVPADKISGAVLDKMFFDQTPGGDGDLREVARKFYESQGYTRQQIQDLFQRIANSDSLTEEDKAMLESIIFLGMDLTVSE